MRTRHVKSRKAEEMKTKSTYVQHRTLLPNNRRIPGKTASNKAVSNDRKDEDRIRPQEIVDDRILFNKKHGYD